MDNPLVQFIKLPRVDCPNSLIEKNSTFPFDQNLEFGQNSTKSKIDEEFTIVAMVLSAPPNYHERMRVRKNFANLRKLGYQGKKAEFHNFNSLRHTIVME